MRPTCFLIGLVLIGSFGQRPGKLEQAPTIQSFTTTLETVIQCPRANPFCEFDRRPILNTIARDPDNGRLTYRYSVEAGRIEGEGPDVIWNLEEALIGKYKVTVIVEDARGQRASRTLTVTVDMCTSCDDLPPPQCPKVTVECPSEIEKAKLLNFVAIVTGREPTLPISYRWTVDSGRINEGQYTKKITMQLSRFPFEKVTATVTVGGYDPSCLTEASCTTRIKE